MDLKCCECGEKENIKNKKYVCSKTKEVVCSLDCYKRAIARVGKWE